MRKNTAFVIALAILSSFAACSTEGGSAEADVAATASAEVTVKEETETETSAAPEETTAEETTAEETTKPVRSRVELDMSSIKEYPTVKYGSELACAALLLNFVGYDATEDDLLDLLEICEAPDENGLWLSPYTYYIGIPGESKYGSRDWPISDTVKAYISRNGYKGYLSVNSGVSADVSSIQKIIDNNLPLIIWATKDMKEGYPIEILPCDTINETFEWRENTQCFLVIGYDNDTENFILYDPCSEERIVEYSYDNVLQVMSELDDQSVKLLAKKE